MGQTAGFAAGHSFSDSLLATHTVHWAGSLLSQRRAVQAGVQVKLREHKPRAVDFYNQARRALYPGLYSSRKAIIIALDTFCESFKKRCLLCVVDDFCQPVVDGPATPAEVAFKQFFVKPFDMQVNFAVFRAFADRAFHDLFLCSKYG
jgi:hypothetical protein